MEENMISLYTWFPLVGIGIFILGLVIGVLITYAALKVEEEG